MSQSEKDTNALIASWFHVGEEVVIPYPNNPAGALATVLGFGKRHIGYGGFSHKLAGTYIDFMTVLVTPKQWKGPLQGEGAEFIKRPHFPEPASPIAANLRLQAMKDLLVRIGDLPDTLFWVGDDVQLGKEDHAYTISEVCYEEIEKGRPVQYHLVTPEFPKQGWYATDEDLTLVERGNIWKLENGEPLSFPGATETERLTEEAKFYKSLGMSQKVLGEEHGMMLELWKLFEGIQKLQRGEADQLIVKDRIAQHVILIKYDNEEFGARMRAAELARLGC